MNIINLKTQKLIEKQSCDLSVQIGDYNIKFFGIPLLFGAKPFESEEVIRHFDHSLEDIIPYMCAGVFSPREMRNRG